MKPLYRIIALLLCCSFIFLLPGCYSGADPEQNVSLRVTATTYPLYLLTSAITAGVEQVQVSRLNTGSVSCLHDYTLTVSDMRHLEQSDLLILNGAGLETFLDHALNQLSAVQVDCSQVVPLLEGDSHEEHSEGHNGHDHQHEHDPHYWMDPNCLIYAADAITSALCQADPSQQTLYQANAETVCASLRHAYDKWQAQLSQLTGSQLITFHDGFYYFADAFGLEILFSMEEEDGATASARDILTASMLVREYSLTAIFAEVNGSAAAARAVSGETGAAVYRLSMIMDGNDAPRGADAAAILELYLAPFEENITTLAEVLK